MFDEAQDLTYRDYLKKYPPVPQTLVGRFRVSRPDVGKVKFADAQAQLDNPDLPDVMALEPRYFPSKIKGTPIKAKQVINADIDNQESTFYGGLLKFGMNQTLAKYNTDSKHWQGILPQKYMKQTFQTVKKNYQRMQRSKQVLQYQLSPQQIQNQLPQMVKQILAASQEFKVSGIGPVSKNGIPLYAGRYWNPTTNRIDLLPKVSSKLRNPFSLKQKIKQLQGRVLNKWNQYVRQTQTLINFQRKNFTQDSYKAQQAKKLQKSLAKGTDKQSVKSKLTFLQKVKNLIIKYLTGTLPQGSPYNYIFDRILSSLLGMDITNVLDGKIYKLVDVMFSTSPKSSQSMTPIMYEYIKVSFKFLQEVDEQYRIQIINQIQNDDQLNYAAKQAQIKAYSLAFQSLNPLSYSRVASAVQKLVKLSLPIKRQLKYKQAQTQLRAMQKFNQKSALMKHTESDGQRIVNSLKNITKNDGLLNKTLDQLSRASVTALASFNKTYTNAKLSQNAKKISTVVNKGVWKKKFDRTQPPDLDPIHIYRTFRVDNPRLGKPNLQHYLNYDAKEMKRKEDEQNEKVLKDMQDQANALQKQRQKAAKDRNQEILRGQGGDEQLEEEEEPEEDKKKKKKKKMVEDMKTNLREKYDKKRKDRESEFGKYMAMPATGPESKPPEAMEVA